MNNFKFNVLRMMVEEVLFDPVYYANILYKTEEEVLVAYNELVDEGYIEEGKLTKKGFDFIDEYKIDNAIILAAGMSSRFVPLNFETPKGLLKVKGETLIERQIIQLREKGIKEIIVVVGYMKEKFDFLKEKYGAILVETEDYQIKNNHASVYAARKYLKNTIVTSCDLYFTTNVFQQYAYDAYYCSVYVSGKTAERGIITDNDDKILETMYGDRCHDTWVTLGYAFFSKRFSENFIKTLEKEIAKPEIFGKFWADIQDEHLDMLYMYAKRCDENVIYEFDSLEELREFDDNYLYNSGSVILHKICYLLAVSENNIVGIESLRQYKDSIFRFRCKGDSYICDIAPDERERFYIQGRVYYQCRDFDENSGVDFKVYKMDKNIKINGVKKIDIDTELKQLVDMTREFNEYHKNSVPLCAAENIISKFVNLPLSYGFQERYIMNNTYSFNMDDNFIGCEKLFPFYQKLSEVCERIFDAKYTDPRPFTGMHCIDMITKTICKSGDKMMILGARHGGHASVKPVVERLGVTTYEAPYDMDEYDLDYVAANAMIEKEKINYVLLAPSDLIKPLDVEQINTDNCVLLWDCSQLMGLIAAGLCPNPLKTKKNVIMFGGTHKTFPGPASGLILTNEKYLHDMMETQINPKYLRHSQMHQKISLLFALIEFEMYGASYMSHMIHCSNYLGKKLKQFGFDVADYHEQISSTHQVFIRCSKEEMETIYNNAYKCGVTLNKKHKDLFLGYGIRLGTQEIARYDWQDKSLDIVASIIAELAKKDIDLENVEHLKSLLPKKTIKYTFTEKKMEMFNKILI